MAREFLNRPVRLEDKKENVKAYKGGEMVAIPEKQLQYFVSEEPAKDHAYNADIQSRWRTSLISVEKEVPAVYFTYHSAGGMEYREADAVTEGGNSLLDLDLNSRSIPDPCPTLLSLAGAASSRGWSLVPYPSPDPITPVNDVEENTPQTLTVLGSPPSVPDDSISVVSTLKEIDSHRVTSFTSSSKRAISPTPIQNQGTSSSLNINNVSFTGVMPEDNTSVVKTSTGAISTVNHSESASMDVLNENVSLEQTDFFQELVSSGKVHVSDSSNRTSQTYAGDALPDVLSGIVTGDSAMETSAKSTRVLSGKASTATLKENNSAYATPSAVRLHTSALPTEYEVTVSSHDLVLTGRTAGDSASPLTTSTPKGFNAVLPERTTRRTRVPREHPDGSPEIMAPPVSRSNASATFVEDEGAPTASNGLTGEMTKGSSFCLNTSTFTISKQILSQRGSMGHLTDKIVSSVKQEVSSFKSDTSPSPTEHTAVHSSQKVVVTRIAAEDNSSAVKTCSPTISTDALKETFSKNVLSGKTSTDQTGQTLSNVKAGSSTLPATAAPPHKSNQMDSIEDPQKNGELEESNGIKSKTAQNIPDDNHRESKEPVALDGQQEKGASTIDTKEDPAQGKPKPNAPPTESTSTSGNGDQTAAAEAKPSVPRPRRRRNSQRIQVIWNMERAVIVACVLFYSYIFYLFNIQQCPLGYLKCVDDSCIALTRLCNGEFDCPDRVDEMNCEDCEGRGFFHCTQIDACLSKSRICDGVNDCVYHEDETNCSSCQGFVCQNGWCLLRDSRCNSILECPNSEDEAGCPCKTNEMVCENDEDRKCIPEDWLCDGVVDCDSKEDEVGCLAIKSKYEGTCSDGFECRNHSACIESNLRCDQVRSCTDGSDEDNCVYLAASDLLKIYSSEAGKYVPVCATQWPTSDVLNNLVCSELGAGTFKSWKVLEADKVDEKHKRNGFMAVKSEDVPASPHTVLDFMEFRQDCSSNELISIECAWDNCGTAVRAFRPQLTTEAPRRIINGNWAKAGQYPWFGALLYFGLPVCGVGLISRDWVITAAHCVHNRDHKNQRFSIRFGTTYLVGNSTDDGLQIRLVTSFHIHPGWDPSTGVVRNDIALLRLDAPVNYTDHVRPVCILTHEPASYDDFVECRTAGFGDVDPEIKEVFAGNLLEVRLPIILQAMCGLLLSDYYDNATMLCSGSPSGLVSICTGDSGGPFTCRDARHVWTLVGVSSWTPMEETNQRICAGVSVFAKVSAYLEWIKKTTGQ